MLTRQARGSRAAIGGDLSKSFLTFERKIFAFQGYWIAISSAFVCRFMQAPDSRLKAFGGRAARIVNATAACRSSDYSVD
jgi:hypothetical protein